MSSKKVMRWLVVLAMLLPVLASCAQPTPQVITKVETVVVEKEVPVEKQVVQTVVVETEKEVVRTVVVKETVVTEKEVVKVVTPTAVPEPDATPLPAFNVPFKNPDTWIYATIGEPETLDPAWTYETSGSEIEASVYEGLVFFNREDAESFVPALAESWTLSEDGLTYVFNIRDGVVFHKGGTLEPHDIAYSIQRALLQDRLDGPQWMTIDPILGYGSIKDAAMDVAGVDSFDDVDAASITAVGEMVQEAVMADDAAGTVTIKLKAPTPWFLQLLAQPFLGAALDMEWMVENGDWDGDPSTWVQWNDPAQEDTILFNDMNGTGPYAFDHWTPGEEIVLVANENYWRTEPIWEGGPSGVASIKRVVWKLVEEWGTRLAMLQAGDADAADVPRAYISQVDPMVMNQYNGIDENAPMQVINPNGSLKLFVGYPTVVMTPAMFNFQIDVEGGNPFIGSGEMDGNGIPADFFSDIDVRKAFNYCMDWDTLIRDALQGEGIQARGPIIQGMLGANPDSDVYTYDLDKAEEHFKAAWDGELWDTGFYLQLAYNTGNELRRIAAEILELNVEAVNPSFDIVVLNLPWPSYLAARRAAKLPISISGWLEDYHDPSNWVHPYMHCSAGAYARAQSFPEEFCTKAEALMAEGVSLTDPELRRPIYEELQQMAYDWAIDIFLYQATGRRYMQAWMEGNYYNPLYPGQWPYALTKVAP